MEKAGAQTPGSRSFADQSRLGGAKGIAGLKFYFDSSALTKRYIRETGSDRVDSLFFEADSVVVSSLCLPEIISALSRLRREKKLNARQYDQCKQAALEDFAAFEVCPLSPEVLKTGIAVLEQTDLRAADALHVASAIETKVARFISSDARQIAAAKKFSLAVDPV
jgi:uncharacterized protein